VVLQWQSVVDLHPSLYRGLDLFHHTVLLTASALPGPNGRDFPVLYELQSPALLHLDEESGCRGIAQQEAGTNGFDR